MSAIRALLKKPVKIQYYKTKAPFIGLCVMLKKPVIIQYYKTQDYLKEGAISA